MRQDLSIVQVVTRRQLRGAEVFAARLSEGLAQRGCAVRLCGLYPPLGPELVPAGVVYEDLHRRRPRWLSAALVRRLSRLFDEVEPMVVQANGSDTLKYSVLARRLARVKPRLVYRNISIASHWTRGGLHRKWQRWLLASVDHVVSVTESSRTDLLVGYGLDPERVSVIPRAVEVPEVPPSIGTREWELAREQLTARAGCRQDAPIVLHVGSFTAEKNHLGLLRAFALVLRSWPEAQLVLLGEGPLREEVLRAALRPPLAGRVFSPGADAAAAKLVAGADVCVLFSEIEGMPGVVLEAGAMARPVVATRVGGVGEVIEHEASGLLVERGDESSMATAIGRVLGSPELASSLGLALRERVRTGYSLPVIVDRYHELYERLGAV